MNRERNLTLDQGGYNPLQTGICSLSYCCISAVITGIPDCLLSGNPNGKVKGLHGTTFVEQVTFMTMKIWLQITAFYWSYITTHQINIYIRSTIYQEAGFY